MDINMTSGASMDHRHQYGAPAAARTMDTNLVSVIACIMEVFQSRVNPENEALFILDSFLLPRVRVILWWGSISGGRTNASSRCYKLPCWYPGMPAMLASRGQHHSRASGSSMQQATHLWFHFFFCAPTPFCSFPSFYP